MTADGPTDKMIAGYMGEVVTRRWKRIACDRQVDDVTKLNLSICARQLYQSLLLGKLGNKRDCWRDYLRTSITGQELKAL